MSRHKVEIVKARMLFETQSLCEEQLRPVRMQTDRPHPGRPDPRGPGRTAVNGHRHDLRIFGIRGALNVQDCAAVGSPDKPGDNLIFRYRAQSPRFTFCR